MVPFVAAAVGHGRRRSEWPDIWSLSWSRLVIGSGVACALAESKQITTAFGALAVGVATPLIVERLTRAIPLTGSTQDTPDADMQVRGASSSELNGQRTPVDEQRACTDEAEIAASWSDRLDRVGE
jgi:hypothetical protein